MHFLRFLINYRLKRAQRHNYRRQLFSTRVICFSAVIFGFVSLITGPIPFKTRDITKYCQDILSILAQAATLSERVTANKLVDAWCGKGQTRLRVREVKAPDLSREDCERVIVDLLLEGVLREDFHFTPYTTISYLLPGPKAELVHAGKRLLMDFREDSGLIKVSGKTEGATKRLSILSVAFGYISENCIRLET